MGIKVKDLAEMLGLSPATVSLVLNGKPGISEATKERIMEKVRELGYEDMLSQKTQGKKNILFWVYRKNGVDTASSLYFSQIFSEIIEGVEKQVKRRGYKLLIAYMDQRSIEEEIEKIEDDDVSGVIILATEMQAENLKQMIDSHNLEIPLVILDNYIEQKKADCITINNQQGVAEAIRYFYQKGHRHIGYLHILGNANNFDERYFGFIRIMRDLGLTYVSKDIIEITSKGGDSLFSELKEKLPEKGKEKMPTAFFADNDIIAMAALKVFQEKAYEVPEDISLIGFDNMTMAEMVDPPLTTVQIPRYQLGVVTVNTLIDRIKKHGDGILKIELGTELIERSSVKHRKNV